MQLGTEQLRGQLWQKLQQAWQKCVNSKEVAIGRIQGIIHDIMGKQSKDEIEYVTRNIFRLDVDGNGSVDFFEFANFLFKRHCGEMSLQKHHKEGKMKHGAERKLLVEEFETLMNNAYRFLGVCCPPEVALFVFEQEDKDKDGFLTYVEYFNVIQKYVCKMTKDTPPPVSAQVIPEAGPERNSKIRVFFWSQLHRLYEAYVKGRTLPSAEVEIRQLIISLMGPLSNAQLDFIVTKLFNKGLPKNIEFESFIILFIFIVAEFGLNRYLLNNPGTKKTLNSQQFITLIINSFRFLQANRLRHSLLALIFAKIDKNSDGLISFDQYLLWVKNFLAVVKYFGDEYYVYEDDADLNKDYIEEPLPLPTTDNPNFKFPDYSLARQVRQATYRELKAYDSNGDCSLEEPQIRKVLVGLLGQSAHEQEYVIKNVFRYDRNQNGEITFEEMTNFCVQQHFGEMAIQKLHMKHTYSRGKDRMMNCEEFGITLTFALKCLNIVPSVQTINMLYYCLDVNKDGWITYQLYFLFLKYYFGSLSEAAKDTKNPYDLSSTNVDNSELSPWDRFIKLLHDQLRVKFLIYDSNQNNLFEEDQIDVILRQVFGLDDSEVNYFLSHYFLFGHRQNKSMTFEQLITITLSIYFIEILLKRRFQHSPVWKTKLISLEDFIAMITEGSFFIKNKPNKQDLVFIFSALDTDNDKFITFTEYINFIKKYLGNGIDFSPKPLSVAAGEMSHEESSFIDALWSQLKEYFDKYDQGSKGYLIISELKSFVVQVLNETSQRELDYIFWNLFRVDVNNNKKIEFEEFAPFIMNHAGQIALQKFHREQEKGKNSLTENELFTVLFKAYKFLRSMQQTQPAIKAIHVRLGKGNNPSYSDLLVWIHKNLAQKKK